MLTDEQARILLDEIDRAARRVAAARAAFGAAAARGGPLGADIVGAESEARALMEKLEATLNRLLTESVADVRQDTEAGFQRIDDARLGEPMTQMWRRIYRTVLARLDDVEAAAA